MLSGGDGSTIKVNVDFSVLRATRGAGNLNHQVTITHAWHVCSELRLDFHQECMECIDRNLITFVPSITRNMITFSLTSYHVKLTQNTSVGAKAISPSIRSLNPLNLKIKIKILICHPYSFRKHCYCKQKIDADHS